MSSLDVRKDARRLLLNYYRAPQAPRRDADDDPIWATARTLKVSYNGERVFARSWGEAGPAVLFVHGIMGRGGQSAPFVPSLLERGFRDAVFDVRGARRARQGERIPFAITWRSRIVGTTSYWYVKSWDWPDSSPLRRAGLPDSLEIGSTWLAASAQRTRCNTEAKYLLLEHAFGVWGVHRAAFRTDERNEASRGALLRLGARFEGIHRADLPARDGTVRNSAFYSIVGVEWPAVRERLVTMLSNI